MSAKPGSKKRRFPLGFQTLEDDATFESVKIRHKLLTIQLRRLIAWASIIFVAAQVVCSNLFFWHYLRINVGDVEPTIMLAWLSTSVVEIVGILGIVALSLFPNKNGKRGRSVKSA